MDREQLHDETDYDGVEWQDPTPVSPPVSGEVHVGRVRMADAEESLERLEAILNDEERARASAFRSVADRARYMTGRASLKRLLGHYLDVAPHEIVLETNPFGKPGLTGTFAERIQFNVSRSVEMLLFAFASSDVGVDVEEVRTDLAYRDMAKRFFSATENRMLDAVSPTYRLECFFDLWARKEAYSKGIGHGLSIPPETYTVTMDGKSTSAVIVESGPDHTGWSTMGLDVDAGYAGAVAMEGSDWRIQTFDAALISG